MYWRKKNSTMDNSGALSAPHKVLSYFNNPFKYVLAELAVLAEGQLTFLYLSRTVFTTSLFWSQWQMRRWQEIFCLIGWRSKPLRILYWVNESNRNCRFGTRSFHTPTYIVTTSLFIANHDVKTLTSFRFAICVSPRTTFSIFFFSFI